MCRKRRNPPIGEIEFSWRCPEGAVKGCCKVNIQMSSGEKVFHLVIGRKREIGKTPPNREGGR